MLFLYKNIQYFSVFYSKFNLKIKEPPKTTVLMKKLLIQRQWKAGRKFPLLHKF